MEAEADIPNQVFDFANLGFGRTQQSLVDLHLLEVGIQEVFDACLFLHEGVTLCPNILEQGLLVLQAGKWPIDHVIDLEYGSVTTAALVG